jgi:hypothetical protein
MINYKVDVDLANFFSTNAMSKFKMGKYNIPFCKIFVEATDPDDAVNKVLYNLIDLILTQDASMETRILCRRIRKEMRITKVRPA